MSNRCEYCKHQRAAHQKEFRKSDYYYYLGETVTRYAFTKCKVEGCDCWEYEGDNNEVVDRVYETRYDCAGMPVAPAVKNKGCIGASAPSIGVVSHPLEG